MSRSTARNLFGQRNLPLLLLQARESVIARFRPIINAHGITEQQWRIVRVLIERGPLEPREIVHACCISSPSLAGVLARMGDIGLVRRERMDHDQRRLLVSLTPKGRALVARMAPQVDAAYRELEARIGPEFTQRFYRTLDDLIAALDGAPGEPHPGA